MEDRELLKRQIELLKEEQRRRANDRFRDYLSYINPKYKMKWFHGVIADLCQDFFEGKVDKLIITLPPQHGKSEISSRIFPSWVFGKDPDTQLVLVSYASDLAKGFCLSVQRYMGTDEYKRLFPKTFLNTDRLAKYRHYLCSSEYFDIVEHRGFMKTVGVSGGLTGNPVRVAIVDDPFKDSEEANSPVQRDKVWDWYNNVLSTRLHNDSRQLMVMTRWHEDDLVGRILDSKDAGKWKLVNIPAICMVEDDGEFHSGRKVGDALWPEEHSLENLYIRMNNDPHGFNCLYQGNPGSKEGRLYHEFKTWVDKKEWGTYVRSGAYLDVADSGTDDTTLITYDIYRAPTGVYNEQTNRYEPLLFALITDFESNPANTDVMRVRVPMVINRQVPAVRNLWCESNSGGRTFGSDVSKKVRAHVSMFYQGANKESRIITNAPFVNEQIIMPFGWESRFPGLYDKVTKFLRVFKANAHDDVPDVLTGIYEKELAVGNDMNYGKRRGISRR
ncbi:MAG: phage terminase large subunit [Rikenellaceae bacterium]|nr:phage terminase large subunit [Rikenellaceae bacterium]